MATPVEPEPLKGPLRFGPYTLVRRIGAGGMGEVFLAREEGVHRAVVVKKVLPGLLENKQFVGRFRDEARVVVRLAHPNIARVYAMGEVDGQLFLAMEYVQGKTLSRLAYRLRQRQRMMPLGTLLQLGQRLCEGLQYAHDATDEDGHPLHLVHRDLSPANVCVSYAGEVKIIDFGAAQSTLKEQQTAPRVVIGNLTYMAPEQARKRTVDRRADVYAAGVVLWELFAWKPLSQRGDPLERWRRAAYPQWEPAGRYRADLPRAVDAFLVRALAAEPNDRFPSAAAMGEALAALKEKLTPGVTDQDLVRLMSAAFPREKVVEQQMVDELLREQPERASTRQEFPSLRAPHVKGQAPEDAEALRAQEDIATEALDAAKLRQAAGAVTEEPGLRKAPPVRLHNQEVTKDAWVPVAGGEASAAPQRLSLGAWTPGSGGEDATAHGVAPMRSADMSTEVARAQDADRAGTSGTSDGSARLEGMGTQTTPGASVGSARSDDTGMESVHGTSAESARSDGAGEATPQEGTVLPRSASGPGAEDTTDPGEDSHPDGQAPAGPPPHPDWNPRPDAEDSAPHPRAFHREGPPPAPEDSPMQNRPSRPGWTPGAG
ncbi:serine/threonine-protein kinase, partial [Corallococcus sicarius]